MALPPRPFPLLACSPTHPPTELPLPRLPLPCLPLPSPACSSNVAWQYGVSGPFWYASGATIQILLFGILAVEIKRKAPKAHTMLEIVRARWGNTAHKVGGRVVCVPLGGQCQPAAAAAWLP